MNIFTKSIIALIDFYRNYISGLMLPKCRFYPTCSAYARQALQKKGLFRGLMMTGKRLLRCHPFNRSSFYDPV